MTAIVLDASEAQLPALRNASGLQLLVDAENTDPALRVILPGHPSSDRSIEILFPEHVTVVQRGRSAAEHLYLFRPGARGERPRWVRGGESVTYERDLPDSVHILARATLEEDGVRIRYEFTNRSRDAFAMITAVTDPRLTGMFHDVRLERTYVHLASGFDLLASDTPERLTLPLDRWLPARYLASVTLAVPAKRVERRDDDILYYNKSRAADEPFIATRSADGNWVFASFTRQAGNVWSNPELTCQHVDPQIPLAAGERAVVEVKLLVIHGSLDEALRRARLERSSLPH